LNPSEARGHSDDLAADPYVPRPVAVAAQPVELPAAVLGVVAEKLADRSAGQVTVKSNPMDLVLNTPDAHRLPAYP
jgi:hypothetical protein